MPNIRESLYQCLANEITATSATPLIELCTTESDAYAITIYVVYNGTSFLELNLNSGRIKSGNNFVGYYRIRQAALQENENNALYLHNKSYYLQMSNIDTTKKIYIRKEIKFGTYSKLLSSLSNAELDSDYKLTDIKYDSYRDNTSYSNGYFVESDNHTYVTQLSPKEHGIIGESNKPFEEAYITNVTTTNITASHIGVEGDQANNIDPEHVESISAQTVNADTLNIRTDGTINLDNVKFGTNALAVGQNGVATESGFSRSGTIEIKQVDSTHMYTQYVTVGQNTVQQLVVPGGVDMSGASGTFATATVIDNMLLSYLDRAHLDDVHDRIVYVEDGVLKAHALTTTPASGSSPALAFITEITQNEYGDISYTLNNVKVNNAYEPTDDSTKNNPITSVGVQNAFTTLETTIKSGGNTTFPANKTLKTMSVSNAGKLSATFQDIVIPFGSVTVVEPATNLTYPYSLDANTTSDYALSDALENRARIYHAHGNIDNDGKITTKKEGNNYIAYKPADTNARLLFVDENNKIFVLDNTNGDRGMSFIATDTYANRYLSRKGTWEAIPTLSDLGGAASGHDHGNVKNNGSIEGAGIDIGNNFRIVITNADNLINKTSIKFDGETTSKYLSPKGTWEKIPTLSDLGGVAATGHETYHDNRYLRYDGEQELSAAAQIQARSNISAGTVNSVAVTSGTLALDGDTTITDSGSMSIDLAVIHENTQTMGSSSSSNITNTNNSISISVPYADIDQYGRVNSIGTATQTIAGHTANYEVSEDGVLTITVI